MRRSGAGMPTSLSRSMALRLASAFGQGQVGQDGLDDLVAHAVERIEAGQGILEHHADPLASDVSECGGRQIVDPLPDKPDFAAGDRGRAAR